MDSLLISINQERESVLQLIAFKNLVAVTHFSFASASQADPQY
jgi:hypothetical protein